MQRLCQNTIELILEFITGECEDERLVTYYNGSIIFPTVHKNIRHTFLRKYMQPRLIPSERIFVFEETVIPECVKEVYIRTPHEIKSLDKFDNKIVYIPKHFNFILPFLKVYHMKLKLDDIGFDMSQLSGPVVCFYSWPILCYSMYVINKKRDNHLQLSANLLERIIELPKSITTLECIDNNKDIYAGVCTVKILNDLLFHGIEMIVINGTISYEFYRIKYIKQIKLQNDNNQIAIVNLENEIDYCFIRFKEHNGIYRLCISSNIVNSLTITDNIREIKLHPITDSIVDMSTNVFNNIDELYCNGRNISQQSCGINTDIIFPKNLKRFHKVFSSGGMISYDISRNIQKASDIL